ncbi:MAG: hypothetical protein JXB49_30780 [Bacteroidales bacterium]|nr:hypothetical protein [Bacteroidales bacterium]
MFTDSQLEKANCILSEIHSTGDVHNLIEFDSLFKDEIEKAGDKEINVRREIHFVTACLRQDFKLIRTIFLDEKYGNEKYTALTKDGIEALEKGLSKYLKSLEKEKNRDIIIKYVSFFGAIVALVISLSNLIRTSLLSILSL